MIPCSKPSPCVGIRTCSDYSPFGVELDGRTVSGGYRFGYQGYEADNEIKGNGNSYTTEFRQLDPRLGRWLSVDPVIQPWQSAYCAMDGNPIYFSDVIGFSTTDNIHIYSNGKISKEVTNDATNTYIYHESNGKTKVLGTYSVVKNVNISHNGISVTKDMVDLKGINTDFIKIKPIQSGNTYLDANLTGSLLAAAFETKKSTGKKTYINQLNGLNGGHSGHGSLGDRTDLQYMGKNHIEGQLHTSSDNFDKNASAVLVNNMRKFGYTIFYTQDSAGSKTPAIEGTIAINPHHHHIHGDASDNKGTVTTSVYKPDVTNPPSEKWVDKMMKSIGLPSSWH
jgi:RHS repeat-associated protein